jgi:acetylornithine deacetylase/succinyl-diaminopimelate desuccinylase-like protein
MSDWADLLPRLTEVPRENGTAALGETAAWLVQTLEAAGLDASAVPFLAQPYRLRLAGVVALVGALLYAGLLTARRPGLALLVAVAVPTALLLELDRYVPLMGWIGARTEHHVVARVPAVRPAQRLIFTAHYDSKTDLLDHVERAPVELAGLPVTGLMIAAALWTLSRRRALAAGAPLPLLARITAVVAAVYGVAMFAALSAGAFVSRRSPGALDDGAACAVLVRLIERLHAAGPLPRTEVEIVLLAGEESGVQGSWEYARSRFAQPPDLPTSVVNLEFIGAAADLAVFGKEAYTLRAYPADPTLLELFDTVHRQRRGKPIYVTGYGAGTDARSFLAHGIPAATLASDLPGHAYPRGLHSATDERSLVDIAALDATLEYLETVMRLADQRGVAPKGQGS